MKMIKRLLGLLLALFITAITLMPTILFVHGAAVGLGALSWPTAAGTVTHSALVHGSRGTTGADVQYRYTANGASYTGDNVWVGQRGTSSTGAAFARRAVARYPVGAAVRVYHHPRHPHRAVLEPGIADAHLVYAHFALVFLPISVLCIGAGVAWLLTRLIRRKETEPYPSELPNVTPTPTGERIAFNDAVPWPLMWFASLIPFGILTNLASAICFGFAAPAVFSLAGIALAILGSLAASLATHRRQRNGHFDLWLDARRETVTLPVRRMWRKPIEVPFASIVRIQCVDEREYKSTHRTLQLVENSAGWLRAHEIDSERKHKPGEHDIDRKARWLADRWGLPFECEATKR